MSLGDSVQIVCPQEEQREEERRHGRENQVGSESDRRHEKLLSEKGGVLRILEGHEGHRKIIDMISETGDEEYGMQCFKAEFQERSGLDTDQVSMLACGIRWAVEARRREKRRATGAMEARRTKGAMAARRAKGAIGRRKSGRMDPARGKRRQGAKKELTDKDEKEKELKVRMIRARKTGGTHWSGGGSMTSGRKEGRRDE